MYRKAEIIEEVYKCSICYGIYIVPSISTYDYFIETELECFYFAFGIEVKIPIITHNLTDMVENIVYIFGGFLYCMSV